MIESIVLACLALPFIAKGLQADHQDHQRRQQERNQPRPGLSSQAAQIKPVAPSTKAYLGPKRPRSAEFYRNRRTKKAVRKLPF